MQTWTRWSAFVVLLVLAAGTGRAGSGDPWGPRVDGFVQQWRMNQSRQAERDLLRGGRRPARAGLRQLVKTLPASDFRRAEAGFALYVLNLDRALGTAALTEAAQHHKQLPLDETLWLMREALARRPSRTLLSGALDLVPIADGAGAEVGLSITKDAAAKQPRDLLAALRRKSPSMQERVATALTYELDGRPAKTAYPELASIAAKKKDRQRNDARRLLRAVDRAAKDQTALLLPGGLALPAGALKTLQTRWPGFQVMNTPAFDARVVRSVRTRFGEKAVPQASFGDFDGNGRRDVALLLRSDQGADVKLVALRQVKADDWVGDEIATMPFSGGLQSGYSGYTIFLTPHAPGSVAFWTAGGKTGRLELEHDGFELNYEGKASMLYYWTGERYATVQTGD